LIIQINPKIIDTGKHFITSKPFVIQITTINAIKRKGIILPFLIFFEDI